MKLTQELKALYRGLKLYDDLNSLDNVALEWFTWRDSKVEDLDEFQKRKYWDLRLRYERKVEGLIKKMKEFIKDYRVSPVLDFVTIEEKPLVTVGFLGRHVRGYKTLELLNPEWFTELKLPKPPRKLVEVFG